MAWSYLAWGIRAKHGQVGFANDHVKLCCAAWLLSSALLIPGATINGGTSTHCFRPEWSWMVFPSVHSINRSCSYPVSWSPCPHGYLAINKLCLHYLYINTICSLSLGYFLLSLISSFVFRAIRDALPDNPAAQERILGASFLALGIADVSHLLTSNYRIILQFPFQQLTQYVFYCPYGSVLISPLSIIATVLGLPQDLTYTPSNWNGTTHGNITVVIVLFLFR